MEVKANSFTLRGESGIIKIVSDSPFVVGDDPTLYSEEAECDLTIESNGFHVDKAIYMKMPAIHAFIGDLKAVVRSRSGKASFQGKDGELAFRFIAAGGDAWVECEMNDLNQGKENSIRVKYPIEPAYFRDLEAALEDKPDLSN
jgi:hypothetical protein